jgi:hypothetical protein
VHLPALAAGASNRLGQRHPRTLRLLPFAITALAQPAAPGRCSA